MTIITITISLHFFRTQTTEYLQSYHIFQWSEEWEHREIKLIEILLLPSSFLQSNQFIYLTSFYRLPHFFNIWKTVLSLHLMHVVDRLQSSKSILEWNKMEKRKTLLLPDLQLLQREYTSIRERRQRKLHRTWVREVCVWVKSLLILHHQLHCKKISTFFS